MFIYLLPAETGINPAVNVLKATDGVTWRGLTLPCTLVPLFLRAPQIVRLFLHHEIFHLSRLLFKFREHKSQGQSYIPVSRRPSHMCLLRRRVPQNALQNVKAIHIHQQDTFQIVYRYKLTEICCKEGLTTNVRKNAAYRNTVSMVPKPRINTPNI